MDAIYLDHNATTPLLPEVAQAMAGAYAAGPANPASQHRLGRRARQQLEDCREAIGRWLGADMDSRQSDRVIFTSGGTEANNWAILGLRSAFSDRLLVSSIEHPSVAEMAEHVSRSNRPSEIVRATPDGLVDLDHLGDLLRQPAGLVSLMLGNNETGVLQPVAEAAALCHQAGALLHTDAVQVAGKLPILFRRLGVAAMTVSAHKFHGPLGIGALIVRHDVELAPLLRGGHQQGGLRPGTESLPLVVGFHRALEIWQRESSAREAKLTALRDLLEHTLQTHCPEIIAHGARAPRLPHTSNLAFPGVDRQEMFVALDLAGIACSTGSACASGSPERSKVLVAMGLPKSQIDSALRFSVGATSQTAEVARAAERILQVYKDLREQSIRRKMVAPGTGGG